MHQYHTYQLRYGTVLYPSHHYGRTIVEYGTGVSKHTEHNFKTLKEAQTMRIRTYQVLSERCL
jgi:hypothetical protein